MLQVFTPKKGYSFSIPHLIREKTWGKETEYHMISFHVRFWCEKQSTDRTPDRFRKSVIEDYKKDIHRKKLCDVCVKNLQEYNKGGPTE